jgi:hypothetical protein
MRFVSKEAKKLCMSGVSNIEHRHASKRRISGCGRAEAYLTNLMRCSSGSSAASSGKQPSSRQWCTEASHWSVPASDTSELERRTVSPPPMPVSEMSELERERMPSPKNEPIMLEACLLCGAILE